MRSEEEMFQLILETAKEDDRIRAVVLQGSRTNPNVPKDIFQDFDIIYVVEETKSFREHKEWIDRFGERLYMQYPDESTSYLSDIENSYGWLIQFTDGNRLDLHVCTQAHTLKEMELDSLCQVLLDKEGLLPVVIPSDLTYLIKKPTREQFYETCNEFWWCLNNVAKGLWREEVLYVMDMLNECVRLMLIRMLEWKIGYQTQFKVSVGKSSKYLLNYLEDEIGNSFLKTYSAANVDAIWESVFLMCELFNQIANEVCQSLEVAYNHLEAKNSLSFLKHVSQLRKDATHFY